MEERIVVPLDGSKVAESVLPYIEDLVSKLSPEVKTEVVLLQVISAVKERIFAGGEFAWSQAMMREAAQYTEKQKQENTRKALDYLNRTAESLTVKGVTYTPKVAFGDAPDQIVKTAQEVGANLIAMSTHGRSGLSRWAFGSVTGKVLGYRTQIPIVVVRASKQN